MKHSATIALVMAAVCTVACGGDKQGSTATTTPTTAPAQPAPPNPERLPPPPQTMPSPRATPPATTGRGRGPAGPFNAPSGPRPVAAPDDSEVTATLARDLVKTRTFKSHPTLAKVEEITDGTNINHKTVKVYLKSGAVKEIPDGRIGDPMTAPAATIVAAVGGK